MKQQILIIHGGDTFHNYEDYIFYLKNKVIDLDKFRSKGWKDNLQNDLGSDYDVMLPRMPNSTSASYLEWKIWFERIVSLLNDNLIIIGHSLGGIFLAKYFSENNITKKVKAVILIAAPFDNKEGSSFNLSTSLLNFSEQSKNIYLIQSKDDSTVPFEQVEKYVKALPNAKVITFEDRGHFNQETFPEIVELIKKLTRQF